MASLFIAGRIGSRTSSPLGLLHGYALSSVDVEYGYRPTPCNITCCLIRSYCEFSSVYVFSPSLGLVTDCNRRPSSLVFRIRFVVECGIYISEDRVYFFDVMLRWSLWHRCLQEPDIAMHVLPQCAFLAALGIWHENSKLITEPQGEKKTLE